MTDGNNCPINPWSNDEFFKSLSVTSESATEIAKQFEQQETLRLFADHLYENECSIQEAGVYFSPTDSCGYRFIIKAHRNQSDDPPHEADYFENDYDNDYRPTAIEIFLLDSQDEPVASISHAIGDMTNISNPSEFHKFPMFVDSDRFSRKTREFCLIMKNWNRHADKYGVQEIAQYLEDAALDVLDDEPSHYYDVHSTTELRGDGFTYHYKKVTLTKTPKGNIEDQQPIGKLTITTSDHKRMYVVGYKGNQMNLMVFNLDTEGNETYVDKTIPDNGIDPDQQNELFDLIGLSLA